MCWWKSDFLQAITANVSLSQNLHLFIFQALVDLKLQKKTLQKKRFGSAAKKTRAVTP
jgi:hypothetical protein